MIRMRDAKLEYFTHRVDGAHYGAWYRVISSDHLEVIGVGMLEIAEFGGFSPESSARSMLENFVRQQRSLGIAMPSLAEEDDVKTQVRSNRSDEARRSEDSRSH
jgi:hypothetical protein